MLQNHHLPSTLKNTADKLESAVLVAPLSPVPDLEERIAVYETARRALLAATTVTDVKAIGDRTAALQHYARMAENRDLEMKSFELQLRAHRRLGQMLTEQKISFGLHRGGRPRKTGSKDNPVSRRRKTGSHDDPVLQGPTLAEMGIDKALADQARKLAAPSNSRFEQIIGSALKQDVLSIGYALRLANKARQKVRSDPAAKLPAEIQQAAKPHLGAVDEIKRQYQESEKLAQTEFEKAAAEPKQLIEKLSQERDQKIAALRQQCKIELRKHVDEIKKIRRAHGKANGPASKSPLAVDADLESSS